MAKAKTKTKSPTKKTTKTSTKVVVAEPVVAETVVTEKTYNFNTLCKSGETKSVTIVAASLSEARNQLRDFAEKN